MTNTAKFPSRYRAYANWTRTYRATGEVVWVESFEAANHFHMKDALVKDMQALRTLEKLAVGVEADSDTLNALNYIKSQMIEVNEKIIKANRKAERKGWYCISDARMHAIMAGQKEGEAA